MPSVPSTSFPSAASNHKRLGSDSDAVAQMQGHL